MIKKLYICNYVLIDELDIEFSEGLTTITGETGAGKSILLGALALILGQRADTKALSDVKQKCIIEGVFEISRYDLKPFFLRYGLDYEPLTILRREISPSGKTRSFINDTPVNLAQLKELGEQLVDIHSQHETLLLNSKGFQLALVDAYAGHLQLLEEYKATFTQYKKSKQHLNELLEQEKKARLDEDYFQYQYDELSSANLERINQEDIEQELETLNHAEEIKSAASAVYLALSGDNENIAGRLREVLSTLRSSARYNSELKGLAERLESTCIEIDDIASETDKVNENIEYDPERIQEIQNQLDQLYALQQKHHVTSGIELIQIREDLNQRLNNLNNLDEEIATEEKNLAQLESNLKDLSRQLSTNRKAVQPKISKDVEDSLKQLGMPYAQLKIEQEPEKDFLITGKDTIRFLFSANKGGNFSEIQKAASGGELSRLMLSIKAHLARMKALPTIIFDEIDSGVSGEVADKAGNIMRSMSKNMQVLVITHLPQIASKGTDHLLVRKEIKNDSTRTLIQRLGPDDRIVELAKMLSGEEVSDAAVENARALLKN